MSNDCIKFCLSNVTKSVKNYTKTFIVPNLVHDKNPLEIKKGCQKAAFSIEKRAIKQVLE